MTYEETLRAKLTEARQIIIVACGGEKTAYAQATLKHIDHALQRSVAVLKAMEVADKPYDQKD